MSFGPRQLPSPFPVAAYSGEMTTTARARRLENNDVFRLFVRIGYAANGVLHLLIGVLALQVAFGGNESADQSGALGAIAGTPGGVVLLWVVPALTTAISSAAGTRVLARYPAEMASFGAQVFTQAVLTPALVLPPIVIALAVALLGRPAVRTVQRITTTRAADGR